MRTSHLVIPMATSAFASPLSAWEAYASPFPRLLVKGRRPAINVTAMVNDIQLQPLRRIPCKGYEDQASGPTLLPPLAGRGPPRLLIEAHGLMQPLCLMHGRYPLCGSTAKPSSPMIKPRR